MATSDNLKMSSPQAFTEAQRRFLGEATTRHLKVRQHHLDKEFTVIQKHDDF